MSDSYRIDPDVEGKPDPSLLDDIRNLYIGRIDAVRGTFVTEAGPVEAILFGEVLIYGHIEGNSLIVERLRRIALYGAPVKEGDKDIGVVSLAGPLIEVPFEPERQGSADSVLMQLHYPMLSAKRPLSSASDDALFPQMERIIGYLIWEPEGPADYGQASLVVSFMANELVERHIGFMRTVMVEPTRVDFQLAGTGEPWKAPHHSLPSHCDPPLVGADPPELATVTRTLGLRFVNFSTLASLDVEAICRTQIDSACQVWRNKAACQLLVDRAVPPSIPVDGLFEASYSQKSAYSVVDITQELALARLGYDHVNYVEVYLVDELIDRLGGGVAHNCGQASAFCILGLNIAEHNPFLLAHELGHVLGLAHLDGLGGIMPSSAGSVMEPGIPNPPVNTLFNCQVLTARPNQAGLLPLALNPIVSNTLTPDFFRPD